MKCEKCSKEHDGSFGSGRFCSRACANSRTFSIESRIKKSLSNGGEGIINDRYCLYCNKLLSGKKSKNIYCSNKCRSNYIYEDYIKKWKSDIVDGLSGYQTSRQIKKYILKKYNYKCCKCGWKKVNPFTNKIPLELEHIDGDYTNNDEENLEILCPNCHSLTKTYKGANVGKGRKARRKYLIRPISLSG